MSFQFNGLTGSSVTISGSVANSIQTPSATQTVISKDTIGNGGDQTTYTVTAGKTFYLYGIRLNDGAGYVIVYANDASTIKGYVQSTLTSGSNAHISPVPIWVYTAGQVVHCVASNGLHYGIWGIEQ